MTVIHVRWTDRPGKCRRTIPKLAKVRWDDESSARLYLPAREREEMLDWWVAQLSDYADAPLHRTAVDTLAFVRTRPAALRSVPTGCIPVELGKWDTGIGQLSPGRLLTDAETEAIWWEILPLIGPSSAWWQDYSPRLYGFGAAPTARRTDPG